MTIAKRLVRAVNFWFKARTLTPQERLSSMDWEQDPPIELKKFLVLQQITPRRLKSQSSAKIHRTDAKYSNAVFHYRMGYVFSNSNPIHGTEISSNITLKPQSEVHRLQAELSNQTFRKQIKEELDLDLHQLAAQSKFK
jgi:hypothetical protein